MYLHIVARKADYMATHPYPITAPRAPLQALVVPGAAGLAAAAHERRGAKFRNHACLIFTYNVDARMNVNAPAHERRGANASEVTAPAAPPPSPALSALGAFGSDTVCFHIIRNLETMHD